jgi:glycosyltransferase involved in cell wall biosynthesis
MRALSGVTSRNWTLTCVGSLERDPATFAHVSALAQRLRLSEHVTFAGELDEAQLAGRYDRSDAFVLATIRETYGMAVAEAIARGLPVVSTTVGAIPEVVGAGGILVAPDDAEGLRAALARFIDDPAARQQLAAGARAARERLHTWDEASGVMAAALTRVETDDRLAR